MHAHPEAYIHSEMRSHAHMTCAALSPAVGKLQQWLLMFHNIVYLCLCLFFFSRAHRQRESVGGVWWRVGCSDTDNISPISCASMLHCSPDSITCAVCFHELITGTLEAWQEHSDHTLMEV